MTDKMKNDLRIIVTKIFYSPATNGQADKSIEEGLQAVCDYFSKYLSDPDQYGQGGEEPEDGKENFHLDNWIKNETKTFKSHLGELLKMYIPDGEPILIHKASLELQAALWRIVKESPVIKEAIEWTKKLKERTEQLESTASAAPTAPVQPQMNVELLRDKMKAYFDSVKPEEIIQEFEAMGYTFIPKESEPQKEEEDEAQLLELISGLRKKSDYLHLLGFTSKEKEDTIASIKQRILSEYQKHPTLDWAEIAARKIVANLSHRRAASP